MNKIILKDKLVIEKCLKIINELGLNIDNNYIEADSKILKKFINKLKKKYQNLKIIKEENYKILDIGNEIVETIKTNNNHPTFDQMNKAIKTAIKDLPTKNQMNVAINEAVKNLPTKSEMNVAINEAIKDLPTKSEMNKAINEAIKDLPTKSEMNEAINEAIKNLPTKSEMNEAIDKAIKKAFAEANFVTKDEFNEFKQEIRSEIQSLKQLIIDRL